LFSFLLVLPNIAYAGNISVNLLSLIALKSLIIFLAWILSFHAIHVMPVSLYGILDLSRVLFATFLGVSVLHEEMTLFRTVGLIFVAFGLLLLKYRKKGENSEHIRPTVIIAAIVSCMLNSLSGLMDKILMRSATSSQLQFWYMLFLVMMYLIYIVLSHSQTNVISAVKNPWIWAMALLFVIADKCLFIANGIEDSKITVMTLIKQSGCIVTILAGKYIFHEKNITHKLVCAAIIMIGIAVGTFC
ncbi:MAG: EamA family transporter, partial [Spirochaetales bacterium]|nr:EamA family transporter [Spirochaetales bacterium]